MSTTRVATHPGLEAGNRILGLWRRLGSLPAGRWLFGVLVGRSARYSGTIGAGVRELEPGRAVVTLRDRPKIRNHLGSIHATALVTFGELASGLAMVAALPPAARAIVTKLEIDYLKKARGRLTAHGRAPIPDGVERREYVATASIVDENGDEVSRVRVCWLVGPTPNGAR